MRLPVLILPTAMRNDVQPSLSNYIAVGFFQGSERKTIALYIIDSFFDQVIDSRRGIIHDRRRHTAIKTIAPSNYSSAFLQRGKRFFVAMDGHDALLEMF